MFSFSWCEKNPLLNMKVSIQVAKLFINNNKLTEIRRLKEPLFTLLKYTITNLPVKNSYFYGFI